MSVLDSHFQIDIDFLEPLLHIPQSIGFKPDVDHIFLPLSQQLLLGHPRSRHQFVEENDLFSDLVGHSDCILNLALHSSVAFRIKIDLTFQFGEIYQLLLGLSLYWLHSFQ